MKNVLKAFIILLKIINVVNYAKKA